MALTARNRSQFLIRLGAAVLCVVCAVALLVIVLGGDGDTRHATAHFTRAVGLYKGSDVRILGVPVGKVTKVKPEGTTVRVDFTYSGKYDVPDNVSAVVVPPSVVSDRYLQLTPVYKSGARLPDHADIPVGRTATPVELDQITRNLDQLAVSLGPDGANAKGSLSQLIQIANQNLTGNGDRLNQTLTQTSAAVGTLADNSDDLFATIRNLQAFVSTLATSDNQVRQFNAQMAQVTGELAGERDDLASALHDLQVALGQVQTFVKDNRDALADNVTELKTLTDTLVKQRNALAEFLDDAPLALSNLNLAYNARSGTLDTRMNIQGDLLACELLSQGAIIPNVGLGQILQTLGLKNLDCAALTAPGSDPRKLQALFNAVLGQLQAGGPSLPALGPTTPVTEGQLANPPQQQQPVPGIPGVVGQIDKTLGGILPLPKSGGAK
jgi:virulence factor Mce-like protein